MEQELRARLAFLADNLGISVDEARIDGWLDELEGGAGRGIEDLWSDILENVVGAEREAVEAWVTEQFGMEIPAERMNRLVDELISGQRTFDQMQTDIFKATGQAENDLGVGEESEEEEDIRLMGGPHKWYKTKTGDWYIAYQAPGNSWVYFEVTDDELDAIFGDGIRPQAQTIASEATLAQSKGHFFGGTASEITGDGNFMSEATKALERALAEGDMPDWLEGPASEEVLGLIYVAQVENKGLDWLTEQLSKTKAFKDRFKGINNFREQGMSWLEAVAAYREYEAAINLMHKKRGEDISVTPAQIQKYLDAGHSVDDVTFIYNSFDRLEQNKDAFKAFNDVLVAKGKQPMTRADQLKFLQGQAPQDLYQTWEEFQVLDQARRAGVGNYLSAAEAIRLARETAGIETEGSISQSMQQAAALALRYRAQLDVSKYGLTGDDIIDISMGVLPKSNKTKAELDQIMQRIDAEAEGFLRQQATPFIGFSPEGRPGAVSLGGLRQEGL